MRKFLKPSKPLSGRLREKLQDYFNRHFKAVFGAQDVRLEHFAGMLGQAA